MKTKNTNRRKPDFLAAAISLSILLLFLSSCQGQKVATFRTGSDGIVMTFVKDWPPQEVYEDSIVPVIVQIANKGAWDVNYSDIILSVKSDEFYINVTQLDRFEAPKQAGGVIVEDVTIYGKSPAYPLGDTRERAAEAWIKPVIGLREQPTTQLFAAVCYNYGTVLSTSLCVDANAFNGNKQKQVCSAQTMTFADQGAPVAITSIENRPSPIRIAAEGGRGSLDLVQPIFVINVENRGLGAVLGPAVHGDDVKVNCGRGLTSTPSITINASLSGLQLVCKPNPFVLRNNEGFTTCVLPPEASGTLSAPNYLGAFRAQLDYLYRDSISTELTIMRQPGDVDPLTSTNVERDTNPGFIDGSPRCDFCSQSRNDPRCSDWPEEANSTAPFSCACTESTCLKLAKKSPAQCVFGQSWCPGTSQCCIVR